MADIIATSRESKLVGKVQSLLSASSLESRNSILQPDPGPCSQDLVLYTAAENDCKTQNTQKKTPAAPKHSAKGKSKAARPKVGKGGKKMAKSKAEVLI